MPEPAEQRRGLLKQIKRAVWSVGRVFERFVRRRGTAATSRHKEFAGFFRVKAASYSGIPADDLPYSGRDTRQSDRRETGR